MKQEDRRIRALLGGQRFRDLGRIGSDASRSRWKRKEQAKQAFRRKILEVHPR